MRGYIVLVLAGLMALTSCQTVQNMIDQGRSMQDIANKFTAQLPIDIRCKTDPTNKLSCGVNFKDHCEEKWKFKNPCTPDNLRRNITIFPHPRSNKKFLMCGDFGKLYVVICPQYEVYHEGCRQCVAAGSKLSTACEIHDMPLSETAITNPCTHESIVAGKLFFPFPNDLGKYVHCDAWGKAWEMICTPGEVWDQYKVACVNPGLMNPCIRSLRNPGHLFKHPCDPYKYIRCDEESIPYEIPCTVGDVFSETHQACRSSGRYQVPPKIICGRYKFRFRSYPSPAFTIDPNQPLASLQTGPLSLSTSGSLKAGGNIDTLINAWRETVKPPAGASMADMAVGMDFGTGAGTTGFGVAGSASSQGIHFDAGLQGTIMADQNVFSSSGGSADLGTGQNFDLATDMSAGAGTAGDFGSSSGKVAAGILNSALDGSASVIVDLQSGIQSGGMDRSRSVGVSSTQLNGAVDPFASISSEVLGFDTAGHGSKTVDTGTGVIFDVNQVGIDTGFGGTVDVKPVGVVDVKPADKVGLSAAVHELFQSSHGSLDTGFTDSTGNAASRIVSGSAGSGQAGTSSGISSNVQIGTVDSSMLDNTLYIDSAASNPNASPAAAADTFSRIDALANTVAGIIDTHRTIPGVEFAGSSGSLGVSSILDAGAVPIVEASGFGHTDTTNFLNGKMVLADPPATAALVIGAKPVGVHASGPIVESAFGIEGVTSFDTAVANTVGSAPIDAASRGGTGPVDGVIYDSANAGSTGVTSFDASGTGSVDAVILDNAGSMGAVLLDSSGTAIYDSARTGSTGAVLPDSAGAGSAGAAIYDSASAGSSGVPVDAVLLDATGSAMFDSTGASLSGAVLLDSTSMGSKGDAGLSMGSTGTVSFTDGSAGSVSSAIYDKTVSGSIGTGPDSMGTSLLDTAGAGSAGATIYDKTVSGSIGTAGAGSAGATIYDNTVSGSIGTGPDSMGTVLLDTAGATIYDKTVSGSIGAGTDSMGTVLLDTAGAGSTGATIYDKTVSGSIGTGPDSIGTFLLDTAGAGSADATLYDKTVSGSIGTGPDSMGTILLDTAGAGSAGATIYDNTVSGSIGTGPDSMGTFLFDTAGAGSADATIYDKTVSGSIGTGPDSMGTFLIDTAGAGSAGATIYDKTVSGSIGTGRDSMGTILLDTAGAGSAGATIYDNTVSGSIGTGPDSMGTVLLDTAGAGSTGATIYDKTVSGSIGTGPDSMGTVLHDTAGANIYDKTVSGSIGTGPDSMGTVLLDTAGAGSADATIYDKTVSGSIGTGPDSMGTILIDTAGAGSADATIYDKTVSGSIGTGPDSMGAVLLDTAGTGSAGATIYDKTVSGSIGAGTGSMGTVLLDTAGSAIYDTAGSGSSGTVSLAAGGAKSTNALTVDTLYESAGVGSTGAVVHDPASAGPADAAMSGSASTGSTGTVLIDSAGSTIYDSTNPGSTGADLLGSSGTGSAGVVGFDITSAGSVDSTPFDITGTFGGSNILDSAGGIDTAKLSSVVGSLFDGTATESMGHFSFDTTAAGSTGAGSVGAAAFDSSAISTKGAASLDQSGTSQGLGVGSVDVGGVTGIDAGATVLIGGTDQTSFFGSTGAGTDAAVDAVIYGPGGAVIGTSAPGGNTIDIVVDPTLVGTATAGSTGIAASHQTDAMTAGAGSAVDFGVTGTQFLKTDGSHVPMVDIPHGASVAKGSSTIRAGLNAIKQLGRKLGGTLVETPAIDPVLTKEYVYSDTPRTEPCTQENFSRHMTYFKMKHNPHSFLVCDQEGVMHVKKCYGMLFFDVLTRSCYQAGHQRSANMIVK